jgi:hypothetical protein
MTKYEWFQDLNSPRQHWLYADKQTRGLVYEVQPDAYSVYGEDFAKNPFARKFLGVMPTLHEAKDLLLTITASQKF